MICEWGSHREPFELNPWRAATTDDGEYLVLVMCSVCSDNVHLVVIYQFTVMTYDGMTEMQMQAIYCIIVYQGTECIRSERFQTTTLPAE